MPVKIRLQRKGKRDQPLYRLVVAQQKSKANGRVMEILGSVNKDVKPPAIKYDKQKFDRWVSGGAQISETVRKLLSL